MENYLEKIVDSNSPLFFQEGMRGVSLTQGNPIKARFVWKDDKWWHVLIDSPRYQPNWIRVKLTNLTNWTPDLWDAATSGIILDRVSNLLGSPARFVQNNLLLEDGRQWSGESRLDSLLLALKA